MIENLNNMDVQSKDTDDISTIFSSIYKTYCRKMYVFGISMGFCEYLCHDAVHDVFCTLFASKKRLDDIQNLEGYLLHCMKNKLFDIYKNEKRKRMITVDEVAIHFDEETLIDKIISRENKKLMEKEVNRLLQKLPSKQRKIILCRFNHNLKFDEIAKVMHMTTDAVKKQLYRGLKLMEKEAVENISNCYNLC